MRHGIADRRGGRSGRYVADAEGHLILGVDQLDVDLRHFAELEHWVGLPVERGDAVVKTDLLLEHPARRLGDAALDLIHDAVGIDHETGICRAPYVVQPYVFIDGKLNDDSGVGGLVLISREGKAASAALATGSAGLPFVHSGALRSDRAHP